MTIKTFYSLSGLPRSGSTLLAAILSQNPHVFVSATSGLIPILKSIIDTWHKGESFRAYRLEKQLQNTLFYAAHGFYATVKEPIIIDKSRAWSANFGIAFNTFRNEPKIIATVRSLPDILSSFCRMADLNPNVNFIDSSLFRKNLPITNENRCEMLVSEGGVVFESYQSLYAGYTQFKDHFLLIEYDDLIKNPQQELNKIYQFLDLPQHKHDLNNIINPVQEDDTAYGMLGLHEIRKKLGRSDNDPKAVLGPELYKKYQGAEFWRES